MRVDRQTVDLSGYPDLVVIYLGMRVRRPRGLLRLFGLGPQIRKSWQEEPDGLLLHEDIIWSVVPPHLGMRPYWRDLDQSLAKTVAPDPVPIHTLPAASRPRRTTLLETNPDDVVIG